MLPALCCVLETFSRQQLITHDWSIGPAAASMVDKLLLAFHTVLVMSVIIVSAGAPGCLESMLSAGGQLSLERNLKLSWTCLSIDNCLIMSRTMQDTRDVFGLSLSALCLCQAKTFLRHIAVDTYKTF